MRTQITRSELAYANSDSTSEPTPPKGGSDDPLRGSFARTSVIADLVAAQFSGVHVCPPEAAYSTKELFLNAVDKTATIQEKRIPKLGVSAKGSLQVGGKSSTTYYEIVASVAPTTPENVMSLRTFFTFKGKEATQVHASLVANSPTSFQTVLAKAVLSVYGKPTQSELLGYLRFDLSRAYPIDTLKAPMSDVNAFTSQNGKYLLRILKTVQNKLLSPSTKEESFMVFQAWLEGLPVLSKDDTSFVAKLTASSAKKVAQTSSKSPNLPENVTETGAK